MQTVINNHIIDLVATSDSFDDFLQKWSNEKNLKTIKSSVSPNIRKLIESDWFVLQFQLLCQDNNISSFYSNWSSKSYQKTLKQVLKIVPTKFSEENGKTNANHTEWPVYQNKIKQIFQVLNLKGLEKKFETDNEYVIAWNVPKSYDKVLKYLGADYFSADDEDGWSFCYEQINNLYSSLK